MAFEALKKKQAEVWGSAPYERVADASSAIYEDLVARLGVNPGESWLDIATGTGDVARRAAGLGAVVTAQDLAPALVETARGLAADAALAITFDTGDCESLPYADASFDVVSSAHGAIFAPDHQAMARELARVCRPGGRLGLTSWRPGGVIQEFYKLTGRYSPPPPEGAGAPLDWGRREYVEQMLGDAFSLQFIDGNMPVEAESAEAVWDLYSSSFGPMKTVLESLDDARRHQFRDDFLTYFNQYRTESGISAPRENMVTIGTCFSS